MSIFDGIIFGLLQGLTEFLPVSSSGHLVLAQAVLGFSESGMLMEVIVHLGTAISIIVAFREDLWRMIAAFTYRVNDPFYRADRHMLAMIVVGIIPTGLVGYFARPYVDSLFNSPRTASLMLLVTGIILLTIALRRPGRKTAAELTVVDALFVGLAQGAAVLPGLSRSGLTISASFARRLNSETAARYSFLVALPAIFGAGLLQLKDILDAGISYDAFVPYLVALLVATLSGLVAIRLLIGVIRAWKLHYFAYYCFLMGLLSIFLFS